MKKLINADYMLVGTQEDIARIENMILHIAGDETVTCFTVEWEKLNGR